MELPPILVERGPGLLLLAAGALLLYLGRGRGDAEGLTGRQRRFRVFAMAALVGGAMVLWNGGGGRYQRPPSPWLHTHEAGYFSADLPHLPKTSREKQHVLLAGETTISKWQAMDGHGVHYLIQCTEYREGIDIGTPEAMLGMARLATVGTGNTFRSSQSTRRSNYPALVADFDGPKGQLMRMEIIVTKKRLYHLITSYPPGVSPEGDRVAKTFEVEKGQ